jgi:predicted transcriptional regulator
MKSRSLTIRLEDDLEQELEAVCAETGRSRGEIVRDALRRQLQLMRFERLRRQALPFGEAAGWLTDDDVFAAISWPAGSALISCASCSASTPC